MMPSMDEPVLKASTMEERYEERIPYKSITEPFSYRGEKSK
jgi:hypothetical protein